MKNVIRLGDTTSHGGRVTTGNSRVMAVGKPIACVGDTVICPLCKVPTVIVEGHKSWTVEGRKVALVGCKTSCGAVLISSQNSVVSDKEMGPAVASASSPVSDAFAQVVGAVKQIANDFLRDNAAGLAASMADIGTFTDTETGNPLSADEIAHRVRTEGRDVLSIEPGPQAQGAAQARQHPAIGMVPAIASAIASRGQSLFRDPKAFVQTLERALKDSRSPSEAIGKLGGEQAKTRLGHTTDPRYVDRYHGPDDMTRGPDGKLAEWEHKGTRDGNLQVAKNGKGDRQGSKKKNKARSDVMVNNKSKKVGTPSTRQGGAYTHNEIDLWLGIQTDGGHKDHLSVHTNTETGEVIALQRNVKGKPEKTLDQFKIDNFDAYKKAINEYFVKGKE